MSYRLYHPGSELQGGYAVKGIRRVRADLKLRRRTPTCARRRRSSTYFLDSKGDKDKAIQTRSSAQGTPDILRCQSNCDAI